MIDFVKAQYFAKFKDHTEEQFNTDYNAYLNIPCFKANENIHEVLSSHNKNDKYYRRDDENEFIDEENNIKPEIHWIMRSVTQYYLIKAFDAMKIDLKDPNVDVNALGKGTPGRIAKMWCGNDSDDITELGSGRWNKEPVLSIFPNDGQQGIIYKEVDLTSCCSHHFLPFSTLDSGRAIIAYKPGAHLIGISKLQRFVNWASKRFWLQEELTNYLGNTIKRISGTEDVFVKIENATHGCEHYRGANSKNGNLTTEFRSGIFNNSNVTF